VRLESVLRRPLAGPPINLIFKMRIKMDSARLAVPCILSLALLGCQGGSGGLVDTSSIAATRLTSSAARSAPARSRSTEVRPSSVRESYEGCKPEGGTWKVPTIGGKIKGDVEYASNTCPKHVKVSLLSIADEAGQPCTPETGFKSSGIYLQYDAAENLTFTGSGESITLQSKNFVPTTSYTAFLYDVSQHETLADTPVGLPQGGSLTFASPFQSGFQWTNSDALVTKICYQ